MLFFVSLFVDGVLAGAVYAPIALAFVAAVSWFFSWSRTGFGRPDVERV